MIKVKICGITNLSDAIHAAELGADALGFVFVEDSPRFITPSDASKIIGKLPPFLSTVGLFVNPSIDTVKQVVNICHLDLIQFHGDESPSFCEQFNFPYIKAISVKSELSLVEYERDYASASAFLLDSFSDVARGGTGNRFDWNLIPKNISKPIIVAGGLNKDNLNELFIKNNPYAVDVSSGVESLKGKKDYNMMQEFILGVRNATL
jgi:phosphoribosylanthranilate isomerase